MWYRGTIYTLFIIITLTPTLVLSQSSDKKLLEVIKDMEESNETNMYMCNASDVDNWFVIRLLIAIG